VGLAERIQPLLSDHLLASDAARDAKSRVSLRCFTCLIELCSIGECYLLPLRRERAFGQVKVEAGDEVERQRQARLQPEHAVPHSEVAFDRRSLSIAEIGMGDDVEFDERQPFDVITWVRFRRRARLQ